jgi:hypothetical protein
MAATKRRGHGEDSIYFDQVNGCWVGAVSLGYTPGGKRRRRTVRGRTKTEVRDKLRALREDIAASVKVPAAYTVQRAVDDWLASGLDGRSRSTATKYRLVVKPLVERLGRASLRELTADDVWVALTALAESRSSATVAIAHNALTRAIRHAEARDLVRRNVSALIDTPRGQAGRLSKALSIEQARALLEAASDVSRYRLGAYVVLCLHTGIRTEEARALSWEHVDLDGRPDADPPVPPSIAVWRSVREHGDTKTRMSRRTCRSRQPRSCARIASSKTRIGRGPWRRGRSGAWSSARGWVHRSKPETSGVSSGPSQLPLGWGRIGRHKNSDTLLCHCCLRTALQ